MSSTCRLVYGASVQLSACPRASMARLLCSFICSDERVIIRSSVHILIVQDLFSFTFPKRQPFLRYLETPCRANIWCGDVHQQNSILFFRESWRNTEQRKGRINAMMKVKWSFRNAGDILLIIYTSTSVTREYMWTMIYSGTKCALIHLYVNWYGT